MERGCGAVDAVECLKSQWSVISDSVVETECELGRSREAGLIDQGREA